MFQNYQLIIGKHWITVIKYIFVSTNQITYRFLFVFILRLENENHMNVE